MAMTTSASKCMAKLQQATKLKRMEMKRLMTRMGRWSRNRLNELPQCKLLSPTWIPDFHYLVLPARIAAEGVNRNTEALQIRIVPKLISNERQKELRKNSKYLKEHERVRMKSLLNAHFYVKRCCVCSSSTYLCLWVMGELASRPHITLGTRRRTF